MATLSTFDFKDSDSTIPLSLLLPVCWPPFRLEVATQSCPLPCLLESLRSPNCKVKTCQNRIRIVRNLDEQISCVSPSKALPMADVIDPTLDLHTRILGSSWLCSEVVFILGFYPSLSFPWPFRQPRSYRTSTQRDTELLQIPRRLWLLGSLQPLRHSGGPTGSGGTLRNNAQQCATMRNMWYLPSKVCKFWQMSRNTAASRASCSSLCVSAARCDRAWVPKRFTAPAPGATDNMKRFMKFMYANGRTAVVMLGMANQGSEGVFLPWA